MGSSIRVLRAVAVLVLAAAAGCGKRGLPSPPEPRGPLAPEEIRVRQLGTDVIVSLRVPAPRGAKFAQEPVRVEIVRVSYAPGYDSPPDPDAFRRRGEDAGWLEADPLPSGTRVRVADRALEVAGPDFPIGWTLRYGARVRDRRGRSSPLVVSGDLIPIPPPAAPTSLSAVVTAEGVRLDWVGPSSPEGTDETPARFNLYRAPAGEEHRETPINSTPLEADEFLDTRVRVGGEYVYVVRTVTSSESPVIESASSDPVDVRALDLFPPDPPSGLVVVQEGAGVRLFWTPSAERDLAGYRVYRKSGDGVWTRLEPDPVGQAQFLDLGPGPGDEVSYRVTAIDRADPPNESEPSDPAGLTVADDPDGWKDRGP
jgi:hypothetical protein